MGTEAIKLIMGIGEPLLGRLMVYDALDMTYRTIKLRKDPEAEPVTELIDYEAFCGVVSDDAQQAARGSTITAVELKEMIDSGAEFSLIDVREPVEWDIVRIPGATLIPKDRILSGDALAELPNDKPIVLHCKSGVRSAEALAAVKKAGFADATHLQGRGAGLGEAGRPLAAHLLIGDSGGATRVVGTGIGVPRGVGCQP